MNYKLAINFIFIFICVSLYNITLAYSRNNDAEYFSDMLNTIFNWGQCEYSCKNKRNKVLAGASIVDTQMSRNNDKTFDKINEAAEPGMGYLPKKMVNDALCKYFGYNAGNDREILSELEGNKSKYNGYYYTEISESRVYSDFIVTNIQKDDVYAARIYGNSKEDSGALNPFIAYFDVSSCNNYKHYVFSKIDFVEVPGAVASLPISLEIRSRCSKTYNRSIRSYTESCNYYIENTGDNDFTVTGYRLNKGNMGSYNIAPETLGYGQRALLFSLADDQIDQLLEVDVLTNNNILPIKMRRGNN